MSYEVKNINDFPKEMRGWICGQFFPKGTIQKRDDLEVKLYTLEPSYQEKEHYHPIGKDIVIVISGKAKWLLDGEEYLVKTGDVIYFNEGVREQIVEVIEPTTFVAIRTPSVPDNKVFT